MQNANYYTISDALEKYMAISGNNSTSLKMQYMVRALEIWKEIRNDVLKFISNKWVQVDKSELPYKVKLPNCASMFLGITVKNKCDEYVSLSKWDNMPTTPYKDVLKKCDCNDALKSCIESTEVTIEYVNIDAVNYQKVVTKKVYTNGDVYIETSSPYEKFDANGDTLGEVDIVVDKQMICNLALKECGCIEISQENIKKIESFCCHETFLKCNQICNDELNQPNEDYLSQNGTGYYSYSEPNRNVYLYGNIPSQVLVNYITTGESESDELIPNYAFMTFVKGMDWINSRYSKTMNRLEKREIEREYSASKSELELKLPRNKINVSDFNGSTKNIFMQW
jgi:hypothetical protein